MLTGDRLLNYPLRQSLLPGAEGLQIFAERGLVQWLSRPDEYLVVCEGRGGRIYAADESLLEEAQQVIFDAHGDRVVRRKADVFIYVDPEIDAWVEPVMFLRTKSPHAYAREVLAELRCREARIFEQDMQRYDLVIRAEGCLQDLIGLTKVIGSLTRGSVSVWTWLERYERLRSRTQTDSRASDGPA